MSHLAVEPLRADHNLSIKSVGGILRRNCNFAHSYEWVQINTSWPVKSDTQKIENNVLCIIASKTFWSLALRLCKVIIWSNTRKCSKEVDFFCCRLVVHGTTRIWEQWWSMFDMPVNISDQKIDALSPYRTPQLPCTESPFNPICSVGS